MKSEIQIKNSAQVCQIDIEGTIGVPEEWQFEKPDLRVATYEKFRDTLHQIAQIEAPQIIVNIRSTGGDVNDALLIHDTLKSLSAHITTRCYGYTASAATIIAQAASEGCRQISGNALYLIHNSVCATEGNAQELESKLDLLHKTDQQIAEVYASRSERGIEEFQTLMSENNGKGRWLSPSEAIEAGLADQLINEQETASSPKEDSSKKIAPDKKASESEPTKAQAPEPTPTDQSSTASAPHPDRLTDKFRSGWRRLMDAIFREEPPQEPLPEDRNILHFEEDELHLRRHSILATQESQNHFSQTQCASKEDPSMGDMLRTANETAYAEDIKCFQK